MKPLMNQTSEVLTLLRTPHTPSYSTKAKSQNDKEISSLKA